MMSDFREENDPKKLDIRRLKSDIRRGGGSGVKNDPQNLDIINRRSLSCAISPSLAAGLCIHSATEGGFGMN